MGALVLWCLLGVAIPMPFDFASAWGKNLRQRNGANERTPLVMGTTPFASDPKIPTALRNEPYGYGMRPDTRRGILRHPLYFCPEAEGILRVTGEGLHPPVRSSAPCWGAAKPRSVMGVSSYVVTGFGWRRASKAKAPPCAEPHAQRMGTHTLSTSNTEEILSGGGPLVGVSPALRDRQQRVCAIPLDPRHSHTGPWCPLPLRKKAWAQRR